ncbi:Sim4 and Mal2 associated protein 1 [Schizosaccharomyces japonicus yFS275]|uniref:Sim4 and Mal2 associated protein 1 n=1 Tax=Schizosaccharomyces japonicus (strain yFS275 / FY16936) TaxID=402676 RepID=B6K086_SCHJY|nr:Sim4 and Mal2 associated protein 1 [Schizosaccharomyces japonicus yFS275]EEB06236.1 Sim4 and Mal2 associated protein 1 [Schizosaccharomyces japonicus yFS275]
MPLRDHNFYNVTYTTFRGTPWIGFELDKLDSYAKELSLFFRYGSTRQNALTRNEATSLFTIDSVEFLKLGAPRGFKNILKLRIVYSPSTGSYNNKDIKKYGQLFLIQFPETAAAQRRDSTHSQNEIDSSQFTSFSLILCRISPIVWGPTKLYLEQRFDTFFENCQFQQSSLIKVLEHWQRNVTPIELSVPLEFQWFFQNPNLSSCVIGIPAVHVQQWLKLCRKKKLSFYETVREYLRNGMAISLDHPAVQLSKIVVDTVIISRTGKLKFFTKCGDGVPTILQLLLDDETLQFPSKEK